MRILFLYLTEANPILPKQYAKSIVYQDRPDITLLYFFKAKLARRRPRSPPSGPGIPDTLDMAHFKLVS